MGGICSQSSKQSNGSAITTDTDLNVQNDQQINKNDVTSLIGNPEDLPGIVTRKQKREAVNSSIPQSSRKYSDMHKLNSSVRLSKSGSQINISEKLNQSINQKNSTNLRAKDGNSNAGFDDLIENLNITYQLELINPNQDNIGDEFINEMGDDNKLLPEQEDNNSSHISQNSSRRSSIKNARNLIKSSSQLSQKQALNDQIQIDLEQQQIIPSVSQKNLQEDISIPPLEKQISNNYPQIMLAEETIQEQQCEQTYEKQQSQNNVDNLQNSSSDQDMSEEDRTSKIDNQNDELSQIENLLQTDDQIIEQQDKNNNKDQFLKQEDQIQDIFEINKQKFDKEELFFNQSISQLLIEQFQENQKQINEQSERLRIEKEKEEQKKLSIHQIQMENEIIQQVSQLLENQFLDDYVQQEIKLLINEQERELQQELDIEKLRQEMIQKQLQEIERMREENEQQKILNQLKLDQNNLNQKAQNVQEEDQLVIDENENEEFFKQLEEEDKIQESQQLNFKISMIELDEEDKQVDVKMKEDEEALKLAENTLQDYVQRWAVKTVELNIGGKLPANSNPQRSTNLDCQSSTYDDTNYDQASEYSEYRESSKDLTNSKGSPQNVIIRKKTQKKRFPLKKKKVLSRRGSVLEQNE